MSVIEVGQVVWAPVVFYGAEVRVRVVAVEGDDLVVKLPGSDAGTETVDVARCFPSGGTPSTVEEAQALSPVASLCAASSSRPRSSRSP